MRLVASARARSRVKGKKTCKTQYKTDDIDDIKHKYLLSLQQILRTVWQQVQYEKSQPKPFGDYRGVAGSKVLYLTYHS